MFTSKGHSYPDGAVIAFGKKVGHENFRIIFSNNVPI